MTRASVGIYIWRGKAYLPERVQIESGPFMDVEPVHAADLNAEELVSAVRKVLSVGHPRIPDPTRDELRQRGSPILKATGARSWKELARVGANYSVGLTENHVRVDASYVDKKGRWQFDPDRARTFPPDTPLGNIVAIILEDIQSRRELMKDTG